MKVLLLAGGNSNERDVSLRSGAAVATALKNAGYEVSTADPSESDFKLDSLVSGIDVVLLALHGAGGEDGTLQKELENLRIPFVGSGSKASELCFDKWEYKKLLLENGISASAGYEVRESDLKGELFTKPYVLKPLEGGSSLDTQIVRAPDQATLQTSNDLLKKYPVMLLEPLVEGTEITVGILGEQPLPVIEIIPPEGREFDYENKYNGATQELCPPVNVSEELQSKAQELALRIHKLTGCRDMSRTDIIIDHENKMHVLETNTIPGMTETSLLPKMVKQAGMDMTAFVSKLVDMVVNRQL